MLFMSFNIFTSFIKRMSKIVFQAAVIKEKRGEVRQVGISFAETRE